MNEEILRPVGGNAREILEKGRKWGADARLHMSANEQRILHHLERYRFAADAINRLAGETPRVLDIGAGDGTGLSVVMDYCEPAPIVDAIELDQAACDRLRQSLPDVRVHNQSVDDFIFDTRYDCTLLFETLGHQHIESDLRLLKSIDSRVLILSIPYYRHHEKKFYFYRLYDPISLAELAQHAMPEYSLRMFGQYHPVNREQDSECGVLEMEKLDRTPDFVICMLIGE